MLTKEFLEEAMQTFGKDMNMNFVVETGTARGQGINGVSYNIYFQDRPCTCERTRIQLEKNCVILYVERYKGIHPKEELNTIILPYENIAQFNFISKDQKSYNGYTIIK